MPWCLLHSPKQHKLSDIAAHLSSAQGLKMICPSPEDGHSHVHIIIPGEDLSSPSLDCSLIGVGIHIHEIA